MYGLEISRFTDYSKSFLGWFRLKHLREQKYYKFGITYSKIDKPFDEPLILSIIHIYSVNIYLFQINVLDS